MRACFLYSKLGTPSIFTSNKLSICISCYMNKQCLILNYLYIFVCVRVFDTAGPGPSPTKEVASNSSEECPVTYADFDNSTDFWEAEAQEFREKTAPDHRAGVAGQLGRGTGVAYLAIRSVAEPMLADRTLDADIRNVRRLVEYSTAVEGSKLIRAVEEGMGAELRQIASFGIGGD